MTNFETGINMPFKAMIISQQIQKNENQLKYLLSSNQVKSMRLQSDDNFSKDDRSTQNSANSLMLKAFMKVNERNYNNSNFEKAKR
jgi:hypothetical protein